MPKICYELAPNNRRLKIQAWQLLILVVEIVERKHLEADSAGAAGLPLLYSRRHFLENLLIGEFPAKDGKALKKIFF